jgi:hypothetical protein
MQDGRGFLVIAGNKRLAPHTTGKIHYPRVRQEPKRERARKKSGASYDECIQKKHDCK